MGQLKEIGATLAGAALVTGLAAAASARVLLWCCIVVLVGPMFVSIRFDGFLRPMFAGARGAAAAILAGQFMGEGSFATKWAAFKGHLFGGSAAESES